MAQYGVPEWEFERPVIDSLIHTILSANTSDINSGRAFRRLKEHFGNDWDAVRLALLDQIKELIRQAGMYNQKAPNIVATLERILRERGNYDLEFLGDLPVQEALAWLMALPGVGHKTASIVLLFCFGAGAFPVDTHIQRVSQRVGISSRKAGADKIKAIWEELLPAETYLPLHLNLIRHGREVCVARWPKCEICVLNSLCDYANRSGEWEAGARSNGDVE